MEAQKEKGDIQTLPEVMAVGLYLQVLRAFHLAAADAVEAVKSSQDPALQPRRNHASTKKYMLLSATVHLQDSKQKIRCEFLFL